MEVMDRSLDNYINVLDNPPIDPKMSAEDKLRVALERQIAVICAYKDYINVYLSEIKSLSPKNRAKYDQKRREYGRNFEKIVQEIKADEQSGLFNPHDPKVVTFAILGMCNWMLNWYKKNGALQPKEIAQIFFSLISGNWGK